MRPDPRRYVQATKLMYQQMDRLRQWRGVLLDALGFAPRETPFRIVHSEAGLRLRAYGGAAQSGSVLLLVPAPIKRAYIWDLAPEVSVVQDCLRRRMRVYLADWSGPQAPGRDFGLSDYADRLLSSCLAAIRTDCGASRVSIAGHSLGGTLSAIFSCLRPEKVVSLVLLEAPLHFSGDAGALGRFIEAVPDARFIEETFGHVPGSFLNSVCMASAPAEFEWQPMMDFSLSTHNRASLANHMRVIRWAHDEFPMPGRLFTETVELLYRGDALMRGTLRVSGRRVGPRDMRSPLLCVIDPRSTIIPPRSILPFQEAAAAPVKRVLKYHGDIGVALQHVGVLVGANAHARIWPPILDWLSEMHARH
ncbi:MAG: alpha/beta hydrolase [Noviherbaspirillum sp.]|nr:alpha/beta hydrolase [Noviherbaspirillum sp.]